MNKFFLLFFVFFISYQPLLAAEYESIDQYIESHLADSHYWKPFPGIKIAFPQVDSFYLGPVEVDMSPSLHVAILTLVGLIMILFFVFLYQKKNPLIAPSGVTNFLEVLVLFVRNEICIQYLGEKDGKKYAGFFLTLFFLILTCNYIGLVPGMSTATANINVTAGLALATLFCMVVGGLIYHGPIGFFKLFIPSGVPIFVLPILFPIELMGLMIKPFSLTVRLFANLLAGHFVIYSLLGLIITFHYFGIPSIFLALFIYVLELLVAFVQAYVFTMLSAMFIGAMLHPDH